MSDRGKNMAVKLASCKELVVFDLETTGTSPEKYAEICEIGAIRMNFETGKFTKRFWQYIKPRDGKIPKAASEINHITAETVKNSPYFEDVLPAFYNFIDGRTLLAHNNTFDERFLRAYFPMVGRVYTNTCLDSLAIDKYLHPEREKHDLTTICRSYGYEPEGAHDAFVDAKNTAVCVSKLRDEYLENVIFDIPEVPEKRVGYVNLNYLKYKGAHPYKYKNKAIGYAVFFDTNLGSIYYNITRGVWGMQRMYVNNNVDVKAAGELLLGMAKTSYLGLLDMFSSEVMPDKDRLALAEIIAARAA